MYNEINMETYLNNLEYWIGYIKEHGGLTLCDDDTGKPVQTVTADQLPKTNWNYDNKKLKQPDWGQQ